MNREFALEVSSAPARQVLAGAAGGALLGYGLTRRFPVACLVGTAGLILLGWAVTNMQLRRPPGLYGSRRGIDAQKRKARAGNKATTAEMAEETEEAAGLVPQGPGIPVL